jgi:Niemann-Pick C1 protein
MIPKIQVSAWVVTTIIISIIDVVGLLYFWDVTISGVSTIYILICVGLAVDYSAHIAHMFKESTGTSQERAKKALGRIGPSVFNAVVSTFLAVVVIGFSTSYVFVVFFKAFFLVTVIAGAGGLWLLPCLLGLFGGDNLESEETVATPKQDPEKAEPEP